MADKNKDRAPNDLPVPETMQIAALLAELMPPAPWRATRTNRPPR